MQLPEVSHKDLLVWDKRRSECSGYLNKKASQSSAFSKGKFQKRWFYINIDIENDENYQLEYFHSPEDKAARQLFALTHASVKLSGGTSFILTLFDDSMITLSADTSDLMTKWVETLQNVISVANLREKYLQEYERGSNMASETTNNDKSANRLGGKETASPTKRNGLGSSGTKVPQTQNFSNSYSPQSKPVRTNTLYRGSKFTPSVRLDIDINSIPPSSTSRHQFKDCFVADVSKYLDIPSDMVEVTAVKPAPGVDWLTVVEFDICVYIAHNESDAGTMNESEYQEAMSAERAEIRRRLLYSLQDMVQDTTSPLYNGLITSKLDPSYNNHIVERVSRNGGKLDDDFVPFSSDPVVLAIMNKYRDTEVPEDTVDVSHFTILLCFEGRVVPMLVPNPMVLTKRCCAIWPFEVKQLLGFIGNMQELWIEPIGLIPRDLPKTLVQPVLFEESGRMGGAKIINATRLQADISYDVQCEDKREDALNSLSKEEMESIKETFQRYDINGDGGISRPEMEELVRIRTADRITVINEKFKAYCAESSESEGGLSEEELVNAQNNKAQYLQQMEEAQSRLLKMFDAADTNGDGVISFTEFIMSEAWWLRCTINPDKAHLF